jgi:diacylglycerol kinase (ATP)
MDVHEFAEVFEWREQHGEAEPRGDQVLVVTNALAGRTEAETIEAAVSVLRQAGPVEVIGSQGEEHLPLILDGRGDRPLVVMGGDGSLQAVVRHLWRRGEAAECPVGLIPLGTGNDFARGVGIPLDPVEAAEVILAGQHRPIDLIVETNGGVVINAVHVGAGARAALAARPLKPWLKIAAFPVGAVIAGLTVLGWRVRVTVDGRRVGSESNGRALMVGVSNTSSIAGGTAALGPQADPSDGLLDVTVSFATGAFARVGYALALRRGEHPDRVDVTQLTGRHVMVSGAPFHVNADGELSGPYRRREWRVLPGGWRCLLPPVVAEPATDEAATATA